MHRPKKVKYSSCLILWKYIRNAHILRCPTLFRLLIFPLRWFSGFFSFLIFFFVFKFILWMFGMKWKISALWLVFHAYTGLQNWLFSIFGVEYHKKCIFKVVGGKIKAPHFDATWRKVSRITMCCTNNTQKASCFRTFQTVPLIWSAESILFEI